jgi:hypothetical protein
VYGGAAEAACDAAAVPDVAAPAMAAGIKIMELTAPRTAKARFTSKILSRHASHGTADRNGEHDGLIPADVDNLLYAHMSQEVLMLTVDGHGAT